MPMVPHLICGFFLLRIFYMLSVGLWFRAFIIISNHMAFFPKQFVSGSLFKLFFFKKKLTFNN